MRALGSGQGRATDGQSLELIDRMIAIPHCARIAAQMTAATISVRSATARRNTWRACAGALLCLAWLLVWSGARAAEQFLPPEQAFVVSARMAEAGKAEVAIRVAPDYYLYRERFQFSAEGATLGTPELPPGKVKWDENFRKNVESYRGEVRIGIPLQRAGAPFTLVVVSQGCADAGLCYPPMTTRIRLDPAAPIGSAIAQAAAPTISGGPRNLASALVDGTIVGDVLAGGRLWAVIGAFFVVGVLLSLTPCVLPMLPILSSIIVGADGRATRLRGLTLAGSYALGMALVYTALGVAAGLAGEGFGAALQTPWALGAFAALMVLFALAMFDVYELRLPLRWTSHLHQRANRMPAGQIAGVFAMGGVSALIVSPCVTAPLASALLFIGQSKDVTLGGSALFSMAGGMSVPLLLLGASAGRWVPRSGPWMHTVKRGFGMLILALAIWVVQPVLPAVAQLALWGVWLLLLGFLLRPFGAKASHHHLLRNGLARALGVVALVGGVMQLVGAASGGTDPLQPLAHLRRNGAQAQALHFQRVRSVAELDAALRDAGRPVMLDFYADWCVSCKEMERFTFGEPEIARRMGAALLLRADVTANSDDDKALLRRFKLFGPPGTLFFDAQGRELPEARVVGFQNARRFGETLSTAGL